MVFRTGKALLLFLWLTAAVALTLSTQRPIPWVVWQGVARTLTALLIAAGVGGLAWVCGGLFRLPKVEDAVTDAMLRASAGAVVLSGTVVALGVVGWAFPLTFRVLFAVGWAWALLRMTWRWRRGSGTSKLRATWHWPPGWGWWVAAAIPPLLLALTPPAGFDALLYHLRQPEWLLHSGRLRPYPVYQFWHLGLIEGLYTWALALGSDRAAQVIGWGYAVAAVWMAARWAQEVFGRQTARWVAPLAASMPSALLLAGWAYVDWALTFYTLAALYAAWRASLASADGEMAWWRATGVFTGLAITTKYTALPLPLAVGALIGWRVLERRTTWKALWQVGAMAALVAWPWYARNAYYMGNPFYPFVFGGYAWDAFRAHWLGEPGTGIGLSLQAWLLLPWRVTLGYRDAAYYHGRIGPLWLGLAPLALAAAWRLRRRGEVKALAVRTWGVFIALAVMLWVWGVARSHALWQARLLWPALGAALPLWAYAIRWARALDIPGRVRVRYVVRWVVVGVAALTLLEWTVFVAGRSPLRFMLGMENRLAYYHHALPDYYAMYTLLADDSPSDARVYFFFEPRSYGLPRQVLPDAILDRWAWDLHRYGTPRQVARALACEGWTHVLVYRWGLNFLREEQPDKFTPALSAAWDVFASSLQPVGHGGNYALYRLPPARNCAVPGKGVEPADVGAPLP